MTPASSKTEERLGEQKIVGQPGGKFSGEIPVPESGSYSVRARFQGDNRPQSDKLYLRVG